MYPSAQPTVPMVPFVIASDTINASSRVSGIPAFEFLMAEPSRMNPSTIPSGLVRATLVVTLPMTLAKRVDALARIWVPSMSGVTPFDALDLRHWANAPSIDFLALLAMFALL